MSEQISFEMVEYLGDYEEHPCFVVECLEWITYH